jgi:hypothetical protein
MLCVLCAVPLTWHDVLANVDKCVTHEQGQSALDNNMICCLVLVFLFVVCAVHLSGQQQSWNTWTGLRRTADALTSPFVACAVRRPGYLQVCDA